MYCIAIVNISCYTLSEELREDLLRCCVHFVVWLARGHLKTRHVSRFLAHVLIFTRTVNEANELLANLYALVDFVAI